MTMTELEIRRKILKEILQEIENKQMKILKENTFEENNAYVYVGIDIAKSIVEYEYEAEPMCLTINIE